MRSPTVTPQLQRLAAQAAHDPDRVFTPLAHEKTRLIECGRFAAERRQRRAQGKPATFDFLGFTHTGSQTRNGKFTVRRKPIARRLRKKLPAVKDTLRRRMHWPIPQQGAWLKYDPLSCVAADTSHH